MSRGDKNKYSCFSCEASIITVQVHEGTVPHVVDCIDPTCGHIMKSHFNSKVDVSGKEPTHELYRREDALSNKLSIRKAKGRNE